MKRRFLGGFAATVGLAVFLACSDLTGPIGEPPGGDTHTRHARISPLNRADRLPTGKGLSVSFLYIVFPGDSTTDPCFAGEYCGVQGRSAIGVAEIFCVNGPGMCGSETYSWSIQDAPPHTTTTFDPVVTATDQPTTFYIQTDSTTVPGTHQSRIVSTRVSTGTTYTDDAIPLRIRCNYGFRLCPELEIVDLVKGADSVVSDPKPKQNTFIGQKIRLRYRWKAGTGTPPYSYDIDTLTAPPVPRGWTLSGNVIKSYDITTGTLTALPDIEKRADTISYYYAQGNATNDIYVVTSLRRSDDKQISFPEATASYNAQGPTSVLMTSQTSSVILGPFNGDLSSTWLAFGPAFPVPGIAWTFTATAPPGDSGYVAGTQLVNARTTFTPPASVPNTNGSYWLDACPLYDVAQQAGGGAGGANKTFLWESNDSPGINLTFASAYNLVSAADTFAIYFMYRPGGSQSIWVPLGKLNWFWRGTASRTGNPLVNHGWLGPTDAAASAAPTGTPSSTFPQWSQVMLPDPNCPTLPTH